MDFKAEYEFAAPREAVYDSLTDVESVKACLPGCEEMEPIGENRYKAVMSVGVAAVKGRFEGTVELRDLERPKRYTLVVDGKGKQGFVKGEAVVSIEPSDPGSTLKIDSTAKVAGPVARVGQRLLSSAAKLVTDKFFGCMRKRVEGG